MTDFKNKNGFSLLEIVVAMGLMSLGLVFLMRMQTNQAKNAATTKSNIELESLISDIRGIMTKGGYCEKTLKNLVLTNEGVLNLADIRNPKGEIRYSVGKKYGDNTILLKSMRVKNFSSHEAGGLDGVATLEITLEKPKMTLGQKEVVRSIDISIYRDSDFKILGCESIAAAGIIPVITTGDPTITPTVIKKVINEIPAETQNEAKAIEETKDLIEKNKIMKESYETLQNLKKMQEEMQKNFEKEMNNSEELSE
jgi:prepilin-type N-terminal cleavage/methylation domain-containing protein